MPSAPDYTNAALVMGLVNLFRIFIVLAITAGMPAVLITGLVRNHLIRRLAVSRAD